MSISVCPIAIVNAPVEKVWGMLTHPEGYASWWDAETRSIVPPGVTQAGQVIYAQSKALGRNWNVTVRVDAVDAPHMHLGLTTSLPLGITVHNHITCTPVGEPACQVSFG